MAPVPFGSVVHAVYFDLDGTLVEYDAAFADIYREAFGALDATPGDPAAFGAALGDAFAAHDPAPFAAAIAETGVAVDPSAFSDAFVASELAHTTAVSDARAVLSGFEDYRLGVLTNGYGPLQRAKLDTLDLARFFDAVVVSGDVGARKPAPELYAAAEERLPAAEYTFVADDLERDLLPAADRGWRAVHVDDNPPADAPERVRLVTSIDGLCDIL